MLTGLYYVLGATFLAAVISDLVECQPVSQYWQVSPDPGGRCRQAFVQLITMAVCNAVTDLLLVVFPIPIILSTKLPVGRKIVLILLFFFGLLVVAVTIYRIPAIIQAYGEQLVRSMWASVELLCATSVANFIVLGSFLRDSGVKKQKFKAGVSGSDSRPKTTRTPDGNGTWYEHRARVGSDFVADTALDEERQSQGGQRASQGNTSWNQSETSLISQKRSHSTQT